MTAPQSPGPFAQAAGLLEDLAGVRLTVKRTGRAAGASGAAQAAALRERAAMITARKLVPLPPSPVPDMLYGAIDGTGVTMTAKETAGREGKGAGGRARTREVKPGVFSARDEAGEKGCPSATGPPPAISPPSSPPPCPAAW